MRLFEEAHAVIGASYGDEGKGSVTYALADPDCTVIKHNGGAQAGHTIGHDGQRFVHSQLGSGTARGALTYLAQTYLVNPPLLLEEMKSFYEIFTLMPMVVISPHCQVVTGIDMLVNQVLETNRGGKRHGSCGHGINETVTRNLAGFELTMYDFLCEGSISSVRDFMTRMITTYYVPRLLSYKIDPETVKAFVKMAEALVEPECEKTKVLIEHPSISFSVLPNPNNRAVFEGGQGLGLDENNSKNFPYVTRSKTGVWNPTMLAQVYGVDNIEAHYVTRPYVTRHGPGPLENEQDIEDREVFIPHFSDETNVHNEWQGEFRTAFFQEDVLKRMASDYGPASGITVKKNIALTCLDHVDEFVIRGDDDEDTLFTNDVAGLMEYMNDYVECSDHFSDVMAVEHGKIMEKSDIDE